MHCFAPCFADWTLKNDRNKERQRYASKETWEGNENASHHRRQQKKQKKKTLPF